MIAADPVWFLAWVCALGIAAGLSLYATLSALGFLGLVGLAALPARLAGLEAPLVFLPILAFYAVEAVLARTDGVDLIAEATQAGIRPLGAGILAGAAVAPYGSDVSWLMAAIAAVLALWAHTGRSGLLVLTRTSAYNDRVPELVTASEGTAVLIVLLGALWPPAAVGLAALAFLAPLVRLPALWNGARAGRYAAWAILSYPFHGRAWRGGETLPPRLARRLRAAAGADARILRVAPALARRVAGIPNLARGWLVFTSRGAYFLYRGFDRTRAAPLAAGRTVAQIGRVFDQLRIEDSGAELLLPKSAPRPDTLPRNLLERTD